MALRQLGSSREERRQFVQEGVDKAKEAVQLDLTDGMSWCESFKNLCFFYRYMVPTNLKKALNFRGWP